MTRTTCVVFAALLVAAMPAGAQDLSIGKLPYAVLVSGQAGDTATTLDFLSRGYRESVGGPIGGALSNSPTRLVIVKTAATVGTVLLMRNLDRLGKKRQSKALIWTGRLIGYGSGAAGAWAAIHNLRSTR